jgi:hypothetical protein
MNIKVDTASAKPAPPGPERDVQAIALAANKKAQGEEPTSEEQAASDAAQSRVDARNKVASERHVATTSVIGDDAANFIVDRIVAGDPKATANMSRTRENMTKVENELGRRHKEGLIDAGQLLAAQSVVRADQGSLNNLTKMTDSAVSFENTASRNFDLALQRAPKAIPTDWGPWLNRWIENGETALGDTDVPPYVTAMLTGANEYAKIMSGSTGAQGSTVDSRREAAELFSPYLSKGQITEVVKVAKQDMANRKASLRDQLASIKERIGGQSSAPSEVSADRPPAKYPDAKKAPDGHWYVQKGDQFYKVKE